MTRRFGEYNNAIPVASLTPYILRLHFVVAAISGGSTGTATQTAVIQGGGIVVGGSQGVSIPVSNLLGAGDLSGSLSCAATSISVLIGFIPAIGQTTGISTYSANPLGAGDLSASSCGVTTAQGILHDLGGGPTWIIGDVTGTASLNGRLTGYIFASGNVTGSANLQGFLVGKTFIFSGSRGVSILSADLAGSGSLSGETFGQIISHVRASGFICGDGCSYGTSIGVGWVMPVRLYGPAKLSKKGISKSGLSERKVMEDALTKTGLGG